MKKVALFQVHLDLKYPLVRREEDEIIQDTTSPQSKLSSLLLVTGTTLL